MLTSLRPSPSVCFSCSCITFHYFHYFGPIECGLNMAKRAAPQEEGTLIKRARSSEPEANNQQLAISSSNDERQKALVRSVKRTSNLDAPIVSRSGAHAVSFQCRCYQGTKGNVVIQAEILSCRFDPTGQNIAACSADRGICMYHNYFLENYSNLRNAPFQPCGEHTLRIPTMASFRLSTRRQCWISNGRFSHPFFTLSRPITLLHILI